jgi:hypothetical protein
MRRPAARFPDLSRDRAAYPGTARRGARSGRMTETDIAGKTICSLRKGRERINIKKAVAVVAIITGILITSAGAETIQLVRGGGIYMIPVQINGQMTVPFALDSGAAEVAIPQDIFLTLIRTGTIKDSDFVGTGTYVMADGSKHSNKRFILRELKVGNHVVTNVIANVVSVKADPLLGQSFLSKLPAWAVDNRNHSLILHDQSGLTAPPATSLAQPPASTPYGGSANPTHDRLLALSPGEQAKVLAKGVGQGCIGVSAFPMGVTATGTTKGLAYWSVRCEDGRSFAVQIAPNAKAVVVDCRLLQANGKECFTKF